MRATSTCHCAKRASCSQNHCMAERTSGRAARLEMPCSRLNGDSAAEECGEVLMNRLPNYNVSGGNPKRLPVGCFPRDTASRPKSHLPAVFERNVRVDRLGWREVLRKRMQEESASQALESASDVTDQRRDCSSPLQLSPANDLLTKSAERVLTEVFSRVNREHRSIAPSYLQTSLPPLVDQYRKLCREAHPQAGNGRQFSALGQ